MDKFDLVNELTQYGVDQSTAQKVKAELNGQDLMDLVSYLKNNGQGVQLNRAAQILGKYGIKLGSKKSMGNYLNAKYESLRTGKALDETFGVMTQLGEGFSYAVEVNEQTRDRVLDWLDENQVEYQATSPMSYRVECSDREGAYRTGRALSEILRKPTVRDSVEIEEVKSKNPNKRVRDAKAKMADVKPRNPVVAAVKTRSGAGAHDGGKDPRKVDKHGRDAKYKPRFDEEIEDNLTEGVIGMNPVNPLYRLRELAGLPTQDDFSGIEIADAPEIDPEGILAAGPVGADEPEDMDVDGMGADPVAEPMDDMDGGMDDTDTGGELDSDLDFNPDDVSMDMPADPMGDEGIPGELGADPIEPVVPNADPLAVPSAVDPMAGAAMAPMQSEAMAQIEDALNSIQTGLADIRLSEYKSLIKKLQDLTNQAQMMGRDYLGERYERRKK
jgi:hypothetical protein